MDNEEEGALSCRTDSIDQLPISCDFLTGGLKKGVAHMYETEYELDALLEQEDEWEWENRLAAGDTEGWRYAADGFDESAGDFESEAFFQRLTQLARRTANSPLFRKLKRNIQIAGTIGRLVLTPAQDQHPAVPPVAIEQRERRRDEQKQLPPNREFASEGEWEDRFSAFPGGSTEALMEHLGHRATQASSEAEAEAFAGALIPLAARLAPRAASTIMKAAPRLIQGVSRVTRTLRRHPATRQLVQTLPTIVRQTAVDLARQTSQGRPVTPQKAVRTLARQTLRILSSPRQCGQAHRRAQLLDRRFHRVAQAAGRR